jgi:hypothetical protein
MMGRRIRLYVDASPEDLFAKGLDMVPHNASETRYRDILQGRFGIRAQGRAALRNDVEGADGDEHPALENGADEDTRWTDSEDRESSEEELLSLFEAVGAEAVVAGPGDGADAAGAAGGGSGGDDEARST